MASFDAQLTQAAATVDQRQRTDAYKALLDACIARGSAAEVKTLAAHVLDDSVPLIVSRQLCLALAQSLHSLPPPALKDAAEYVLQRMQPRVVSFEEAAGSIRELLTGALEADEEWSKAAAVLSGIDLESGSRVFEERYKLATLVRIARLYLEDDDPVSAESHVRRAAVLVANCQDAVLELQYRTCHARVLDSQRRFLEAARSYYEISQVTRLPKNPPPPPKIEGTIDPVAAPAAADAAEKPVEYIDVDEADLGAALAAATTCAILAPAGPQRSRVLATLYKDERCGALPLFGLVEKVHLERILGEHEVEGFTKTLRPHQMATLPDGQTTHGRAIVEHNLLAASTIYQNISFAELGNLLNLAPDQAERVAARMVIEDRLRATIDQVDGFIHFQSHKEALMTWDDQIKAVCTQVNGVLEEAEQKGILGAEAMVEG